jgi:hypothetical protein
MTPAEEAALDEAKRVLGLHFDSFVITTRASDELGNDRVNSDWHGALSDVIGMHRITGLRLDDLALGGGRLQ